MLYSANAPGGRAWAVQRSLTCVVSGINTVYANVHIASKPKPKNVDIKNGKVVFKQKPVSFDKATETMQGASSTTSPIFRRV